MKLPNFTVPRPSDLFFLATYFGGISLCIGRAIFADIPAVDGGMLGFASFFTNAGEWTIGYGVVCYLMGWWRKNSY